MLDKFTKTLQITLCITFAVIILGAYTRLKDAGLGCPDWPGCYGKILAPSATEIHSTIASLKAWIEMIHRYVAGTLGLLILYIAVQGVRLRTAKPKLWILTTCTLLLVVYQALLGMWTVTLVLNPVVVMGHLLGGFTILAFLWWIYLQLKYTSHRQYVYNKKSLQIITCICLAGLIVQIALGGWVSANYAALVCNDFPSCQGQLWPPMNWQQAFAWPGTSLDNTARVTIQMAHRLGAAVITIFLSLLSILLIRTGVTIFRRLGWLLLALLCLQICLGITNVIAGLPIIISLGHNATAVLLLLCLLTIVFITNAKSNLTT